MKTFLIVWDCGFGRSEEIIEAESLADAREEVYERWREEAESQAEYYAEEIKPKVDRTRDE